MIFMSTRPRKCVKEMFKRYHPYCNIILIRIGHSKCVKRLLKLSIVIGFISDEYKIKEMCDTATEKRLASLEHIPNQYGKQELRDKVIEKRP